MLYITVLDKVDNVIASILPGRKRDVRPFSMPTLFPDVKSILFYRTEIKEEAWAYGSESTERLFFLSGGTARILYNKEDGKAYCREWICDEEDRPVYMLRFNKDLAKELYEEAIKRNLKAVEDIHEFLQIETGIRAAKIKLQPLEFQYIIIRVLGKLSHREAIKKLGLGQ